MKDALVPLTFANVNKVSFAKLKEAYAADMGSFETSLTASEEKLADAERRVQELQYTRDTLDESTTRVDED